jgi:hypothetical protein
MIVPPIGRATGAVVLGAIIKKIDLLKHRV